VLDELLENSNWSSKIDTTKIGMAGFSLGGHTAIALAGGRISYNSLNEFSKTEEGTIEFTLPEIGNISNLLTTTILSEGEKENKNIKDNRIRVFVALAPALGQGYQSKTQLSSIKSPILIIGAQGDERTPITTNAKHYNLLIEHSKYLELEGEIGHYVFMNVAKAELRNNAPVIFKDNASVKRAEVHNIVTSATLDFFESKLK
jgi:predicted dienelactone hydrolase